MKTEQQRNSTIDLAKFIAAFFVIGIHTRPLSAVSRLSDFISADIIFRTAVPFFAVCSGYYLAPMLGNKEGLTDGNLKAPFPLIARLLRLYVFWSVVYLIFELPGWIRSGWFSYKAFIDYGLASVLKGSHYHLWYILDLIYALLILAVFCRFFRKIKYYVIVSSLFYLLFVLWYGYGFLFVQGNIIFRLFDATPVGYAVFLLFPLLLLGIWIYDSRGLKNPWIWFVLSFAGLCAEAFFIRANGGDRYSYIIFTYPTALCLFEGLLRIKTSYSPVLYNMGKMSVILYCVHPIFIGLLEPVMENAALRFLAVAVLSCVFSLLIVKLKNAAGRRW